MILILEIAPPHAAKLGSASRHTFRPEGGTIGRAGDSDWVLPHTKVSGRHALISYRDGVFYIEDRSKNGVCIDSPANRLALGRPYALKAGDTVIIDPYEIRVSITAEPQDDARRFSPVAPANMPLGRANPFELDDPFEPLFDSPSPSLPVPGSTLDSSDASLSGQELDPLKLLGGAQPKRAPARNVPTARDLDRSSPLEGHFKPPGIQKPPAVAPPPPPPVAAPLIPLDYDPLAPDDPPDVSSEPDWDRSPFDTPVSSVPADIDTSPSAPAPWTAPPPPPLPRATPSPPQAAEPLPVTPPPQVTPLPPQAPPPPQATPPQVTPPPTPPQATPPPTAAAPPSFATPLDAAASSQTQAPSAFPSATGAHLSDLALVLAGAGLDQVEVTEDLARSFGQILRVVVEGVMDVLRSRQQIKDEFRMRMTHFRPADNNPLKFSANVDDALHNLLVKRNAAYLGPVDAFEDAFADLRNHQIAMLAGMRVAFEFMLAEFDADRLQERFDRQVKKGSLLSVPAKLRYWDLYREWRADIVKDPEASFRKLFGEEFAKAYEEQLRQLKAPPNTGKT